MVGAAIVLLFVASSEWYATLSWSQRPRPVLLAGAAFWLAVFGVQNLRSK